jgi:hypothetical protein
MKWYAPEALYKAVQKQTGRLFTGLDSMTLRGEPPAWHISVDTYGEGEHLESFRPCTDAELLLIYRHTALVLQREQRAAEAASRIGRAVLEAIQSGAIKVKP